MWPLTVSFFCSFSLFVVVSMDPPFGASALPNFGLCRRCGRANQRIHLRRCAQPMALQWTEVGFAADSAVRLKTDAEGAVNIICG
jgi:hypothetical protein